MEFKERSEYFSTFLFGLALVLVGYKIREYTGVDGGGNGGNSGNAGQESLTALIADSLPNYGRALGASHGLFSVFKEVDKSDLERITLLTTTAYITTEFAQRYNLLPGTFDPKDLIAYTFGGLTALLIGLYIKRRNDRQKN
ncbi:MAG: hypothetical protein KKA62_02895 [Nanoarchaeota archaeon]|nr:hypothetical protein [Nanoarchaeota archaeon]MBU1644635.1 hypothetical protein [Nanoarchaeota archaeon]MBU1976878.1 hypothetical protein [Nanoarchaeota archaeon]